MNSFDKELRVIFKLYNLERYYFEEATKDIKSLISKYAPKESYPGMLIPVNDVVKTGEMESKKYIEGRSSYRAELFREMNIEEK